jgi:pilus assembly protein CpaE
MASHSNNTTPTVAVINICLGRACAEAINSFLQTTRWQVTAGNFDAYISTDRRPSIPPQMKAADLRIAFIDFDSDASSAVESTKHLKQIFHNAITVIAIAKDRDPEFLLMAMRAGCSEFLQKPISVEVLSEILTRVGNTIAVVEQSREPGTILSFFGAKGGVGTTTIAVHLAMYLVQCHGKKTLLIDNHAELGHVCVYLGLDGSHFNFQEVIQNVNRLDSELLRGYVAKHASGLEVLSSPETCAASNSINPMSMAQTLEFLRGEYDFVIVDSAIGLEDASLAIVDSSAETYLVAAPEIASLRDLARYLEAFQQIDEAGKKLKVVLNRFPSSSAVSLQQIESAIGRSVAIKLPNSQSELQQAANLGQTLSPNGKSDFGKQVVRWAGGLAGPSIKKAPVEKNRKAPFFSWMQADGIAH